MKQNVGKNDATIRFLLAVIIALAGIFYKSWWGLIAVVPLLTAYFNFCPLCKLLGINTGNRKIKLN